jgi:hypothetical protein
MTYAKIRIKFNRIILFLGFFFALECIFIVSIITFLRRHNSSKIKLGKPKRRAVCHSFFAFMKFKNIVRWK